MKQVASGSGYSYDNQPKAAYSHRSYRHEGVAQLDMDIDDYPD